MPIIEHGDVTPLVKVPDALRLIARAGIAEDQDGRWILSDDDHTENIQTVLGVALIKLAKQESGVDVTVTVTPRVALDTIKYAGLQASDSGCGWRLRDGRQTSDPARALTDAIVAIAENDLAADAIEPEDD